MNNPLVSILIPTRRRPERLYKTLKSIYDTVEDLTLVEVRVRYDNDDLYTYNYHVQCLASDLIQNDWLKAEFWKSITWLCGERMKGYDSLNLMYTELAEEANGKYIMICNDDFWFETQGWDRALVELDKTIPNDVEPIIQFNTKAYGCYEGGPFPITKNQVWKKVHLGHDLIIAAIPQPADITLHQIVMKLLNGKTYYLDKHFWCHDRDDDDTLREHRKL